MKIRTFIYGIMLTILLSLLCSCKSIDDDIPQKDEVLAFVKDAVPSEKYELDHVESVEGAKPKKDIYYFKSKDRDFTFTAFSTLMPVGIDATNVGYRPYIYCEYANCVKKLYQDQIEQILSELPERSKHTYCYYSYAELDNLARIIEKADEVYRAELQYNTAQWLEENPAMDVNGHFIYTRKDGNESFLATVYVKLTGAWTYEELLKKFQENHTRLAMEAGITEETTQAEITLPAITDGNYPAKEGYVKVLGRSFFWQDTLWLSYSASGIEFTYENCNKVTLKLTGDSTANTKGIGEDGIQTSNGHQARYALYLNETLVITELMTEANRLVELDTSGQTSGTIRFVKLSESADSNIGIKGIFVDGTIAPTPQKDRKIEFIGDSITCGYGVEETLGGIYLTGNENATKTYAYKTAQLLDADYSFVSFSGYGIYSAYAWDGKRQTYGLVPDYYDRQGNSVGTILTGISSSKIKWDFTGDDPDEIVINLGTNDASYCKDAEKKAEFVKAYVAFLMQLRTYHPKSKIICTLGIMGADLYPQIEEAVKLYQEETQDTKVYTMKFDNQNQADGIAVDYHPSEKTHEKAAQKLADFIKSLE